MRTRLEIEDMSAEEKLDKILAKLDRLETAIAGDEELGVKGLAQQFQEHEDKDEQRHVDMGGQVSALKTKYGETRSFVRGGLWIIGILVAAIELLAKFVFK